MLNKKRLIGILLSSVLLISSVPVEAFAQGNVTKSATESSETVGSSSEDATEESTEDSTKSKNITKEGVSEKVLDTDSIDKDKVNTDSSETGTEDFPEDFKLEKPISQGTTSDSDSVSDISDTMELVEKAASLSSSENQELCSKTLIIGAKKFDIPVEGVVSFDTLDNISFITYETLDQAKEAYAKYSKDASISFCEYDAPVEVQGTGAYDSYVNEITDEDFSSSIYAGGTFKVAVIDSGANGYANGYNAFDGSNDVTDDNGHGTAMCDIIRKNTNSDVEIIPIKIAGVNGVGSISCVLKALEYAEAQGVNVINMSFIADSTAKTDLISSYIQKLSVEGINIVASAGNQGVDCSNYFPANVQGVLTVGSCDESGNKKSYSNYGDCVKANVVSSSTSEAAALTSAIIASSLTNAKDPYYAISNSAICFNSYWEDNEDLKEYLSLDPEGNVIWCVEYKENTGKYGNLGTSMNITRDLDASGTAFGSASKDILKAGQYVTLTKNSWDHCCYYYRTDVGWWVHVSGKEGCGWYPFYAMDFSITEPHYHHYYWVIDWNPTCTTTGQKHEHCDCGDNKNYTTIPALGHDMRDNFLQNNDGTHYTRKCSRCNHRDGLAYNIGNIVYAGNGTELGSAWDKNYYGWIYPRSTGNIIIQSVGYNSSVTIKNASDFGLKNLGYDFKGWKDASGATYSGGKSYAASGLNNGTLKTNNNVYINMYPIWELHNYSISYNLNDGKLSGAKNTFTMTESFTLGSPTRDGYVFTGWTGSNGSTPQTSVTVEKGTTGDLSYTANWNAIPTIDAEDIYISQATNLTNARLISSVTANDLEDGDISSDVVVTNLAELTDLVRNKCLEFEGMDTTSKQVAKFDIHYSVKDRQTGYEVKADAKLVLNYVPDVKGDEVYFRYISKDYVNTLPSGSKWASGSLKTKLNNALKD